MKRFIDREHTLTTVVLTDLGRSELPRYWGQIERIRAHTTPPIAPKPE